MSVTRVIREYTGDGGSRRLGQSFLGGGDYHVPFKVEVNSASDDAKVVQDHFKNDPSLPWAMRLYQHGNGRDSQSWCVGLEVNRDEKVGTVFRVVAHYESVPIGTLKGQPPPPGDPKAIFADEYDIGQTWVTVAAEVAFYRGGLKGGAQAIRKRMDKPNQPGPVVNSAFDPYNPPLEAESPLRVVRISRYFKAYYGGVWNSWIGVVNSEEFDPSRRAYGYYDFWDKYAARVAGISGRNELGPNNQIIWKITFEFHITRAIRGWRDLVLDRGMEARAWPGDPNGLGGTYSSNDAVMSQDGRSRKRVITDANGQPLTEPGLLDGDGQPLKPDIQDPVWITYQKYAESNFTGLWGAIFG